MPIARLRFGPMRGDWTLYWCDHNCPRSSSPATRDVARRAAALRALHGRSLRLPDALVLATAGVVGARFTLTTDAAWLDTGLPVQVVGSGG